jgi:dihydrodipicolinate synthase/N-acetylneuraminate lyase
MYKAIADVSDKHLILYNIPSRTGINIQPDTLAALKDYPDIAAVKEAVSNPHPSSFMICKIEGFGGAFTAKYSRKPLFQLKAF